jgi:hypothetical protein
MALGAQVHASTPSSGSSAALSTRRSRVTHVAGRQVDAAAIEHEAVLAQQQDRLIAPQLAPVGEVAAAEHVEACRHVGA